MLLFHRVAHCDTPLQVYCVVARYVAVGAKADIRQRVVAMKFYEGSRNAEQLASALLDLPREMFAGMQPPRFTDVVASLHFDATNVNPAAYRKLGDANICRTLDVVQKNHQCKTGHGRRFRRTHISLTFLSFLQPCFSHLLNNVGKRLLTPVTAFVWSKCAVVLAHSSVAKKAWFRAFGYKWAAPGNTQYKPNSGRH